ncbi:N-acetylglucosamine-6-phosphate deacetylase [Tissierella sp. Yu-01]|uniref:N-acetylglucosamine-6-phosphate deacetylase n=1 Tax=Tissierella sp. Yu-01 TaxID=3035694 RepID=UPI00240DC7BD|nr:N-acetylglucosamine-6-phosphate deacetylase [Tissierella sp. Yu-01]WFA08792.1 N-acetylglucosamine-6-phosphate deacetylase [Tissierella sp. Yu-01]
MNMLMLKGNKIHTSKGVIKGAILIEENRIREIITDREQIDNFIGDVIDVEDNLIIPGLIDIHIHGGGGWGVTGGTIEEARGLTKYLASKGVTSFHPTIGGNTLEVIKKSVNNLSTVIEEGHEGARILGIHMEGPFLNPEKKGAFKVEYLLKPSLELMKEFLKIGNEHVIHVSMAPELEGAEEVIRYLSQKNILVSGAHTNADIVQTRNGIDWGIRLSNHTGNAQRSIHHREPGALGGYLLDERVDCELICDLYHIHPDMAKLIIKIKSIDKICLISDSIEATGINPGEYNFLGRMALVDEDGWSKLPDGTIAGSTKDMIYGFKNLVKTLDFSIEEAVKMACINPARLSNVLDSKGSIETNKDADLVVIDDEFNVLYTFVEGKLEYKKDLNIDYRNPKIKPVRTVEEAEGDYIG